MQSDHMSDQKADRFSKEEEYDIRSAAIRSASWRERHALLDV